MYFFLETLSGIAFSRYKNEVTHPWILNGSTWNFFLTGFQMDPISCCLTQGVAMTSGEFVQPWTVCWSIISVFLMILWLSWETSMFFFLIRKVHHGTKKIEYEKTWRFLQLPYSERKNLGRFFFLFLSVVTAGMKISGRIHSGKEMLKGTYFLKDNIIVPFDGFQIRAMAASIWLDFERILFAEKEGWLVESIIFLFTYFFVLFVWPLPPECLLL